MPAALPPPDRYTALAVLGWWRRETVSRATVLVVGAGALGNEVLKNLALFGIGRLVIVDCDTIEASNLSRSVLFRTADVGRSKAEVAARAVRELNPEIEVAWFHGDVTRDLGGGLFRHIDAAVSCVDSREARLSINRGCHRAGRPWVDGALHGLSGEARVFWPGRGACYECTLGVADHREMGRRYSCSSLLRAPLAPGSVATTPSVASIIGGIEAQEVLKILHGLEVQPGCGVVWNGLTNGSYPVTYPVHSDCPSHQRYGPVVECPELGAGCTTARQMVDFLRGELGPRAELELDFDLLVSFECAHGHPSPPVARPLAQVAEGAAACPVCGSLRWPRLGHALSGAEPFAGKALREIGVPLLSVLCGRAGRERRLFELSRDTRLLSGRRSGEGEACRDCVS